MDIQITKTAVKDIKKLDTATRDRILKSIYKLPIGDVKPFDDEIEVIKQSEIDISKGDIVDLSSVEW